MRIDYKYILGLIAFFAVAITTGGQNLPTGTYIEDPNVKGIAYAKRATINPDGTYTIDLETFVTGEVTQTYESKPADIVLVLDVSGSMSDNMNNYAYREASVSRITGGNNWNYNSSPKSSGYYYKYNDKYYELLIGRTRQGGYSQNYYYYLLFTADRTYYINTSGNVVQQMPTDVTNSNTNLLNTSVKLYDRYVESTTTKIDALQKAVKSFIKEIDKNDRIDPETNVDRGTRLGNRIAILAFDGPANQYQLPATYANTIKLDTGWTELGEEDDNSTSNSVGYDSLIDNIENDLNPGAGTFVHIAMQEAQTLISNSSAEIKTVVMFTDGIPGTGSWNSSYSTQSADAAIKSANSIKGADGKNATVWSVGVFNLTGSDKTETDNYMSRVSSNYLGVEDRTSTATPVSSQYYIEVDDADALNTVLTKIAQTSGGSGNTDVSGGSSVTVDVVSSSFSVPKGFEDNPSAAVTVLVAPCNSIANIGGKDYLQFGEAKAPTAYGLPPVTPSINEATNKISTTGFDFSANWCGPDPTSTSAVHNYAYHGYKQIIRFVITVNEDAVGGPSVDTNDSESGIYLAGSDEPLVKFNKPTVKLPVNIWIQKDGLEGDDSAVITIYRFPFNPDYPSFDPSASGAIDPSTNKPVKWEHFTKIMITKDDKIFIKAEDGTFTKEVTGKKVSGLSPDYYYRLKEDAWAWTYTYQVNGSLYTVGEGAPENPFVFVNEPNPVKGAEARARNVFNEKTASSGSGDSGESGNR